MENFVAIAAEALSKTKIKDNIYNLMVVITNQLSRKNMRILNQTISDVHYKGSIDLHVTSAIF